MGARTEIRTGGGRRAALGALAIAVAAAGMAGGARAADGADTPWEAGQVAQAAERFDFAIPAQPLAAALAAFGRQAGLQVTVDGALVRGRAAPAVTGTMTAEAALDRLLAGTGLSYDIPGGTTVAIRAAGERSDGTTVLGPITVEGQELSRDSGRTEGTGSYAGSRVAVGSKSPASIREIPQSVSVVTRQRIEDENFVSLQDAVEETTGMRVQHWDDDRASFVARGYDASILRDGVPVPHRTDFTAAPDLVAYDRVEILRGPAGLFHGAGEPGGSINLVRKRALDEFQVKGAAQAGSWDNYRTEADVTGALADSGRVRGRLAASYQDKESFLDLDYQKKPVVYGTVEGDLTMDTTLSVGGIHVDQDKHQFQGIPIAYTTGEMVELPRHTNIAGDWSRGDETSGDLFVDLEHRFENGATLRLGSRYVERDRNGTVAYVTSAIDPATGNVDVMAYGFDAHAEDKSADANLSVPLEAFGQRQQLLFGGDYAHAERRSKWAPSATVTMNAFNPDHGIARPATPTYTIDWTEETEQIGAYGQANIKPGLDWLTVVAGGRLTWWNSVNDNLITGTNTSDTAVNAEFTPKLGAVADITREASVYGSYAAIFQPQTNLTPAGEVIAPREGEQFEVGLKGELMEGALIAHVAAYQIEDTNRATRIDGCVGNACFEAAGLVRSRGVEAEVSGSPAPGWQVVAGYAYTHAMYVDDPANEGEVFASYIPKHMLNLSGTYTFEAGELDGLSLGGGVRGMSSYFNDTGGNRYTQDAFALFDARIGYELTENIAAQFAVNNIFDEKYYERLGGLTRNNYWGAPRNYMLSIRAEW